MTKYAIEIYNDYKNNWIPASPLIYDPNEANYILEHLSSIDSAHKYRLVPVKKVSNNPIKPSDPPYSLKPMLHSKLPFEVLRDTIIVCRPFNDPTEFQIVAVVDASEVGVEAARDNAKFIVEACNNYPLIAAHKEWLAQMEDGQFQKVYAKYHEQAEDIFKKLTTIDDLATERLGFADNEKKELTSTWNEVIKRRSHDRKRTQRQTHNRYQAGHRPA